MSTSNISLVSCLASGAIVQGTFVYQTAMSAGQPTVATATDGTTGTAQKIIGMAIEGAADGAQVTVQLFGLFEFARASASVAAGAFITSTGSGEFKVAASGDNALGRLLFGKGASGATADNAEAVVLLFATPLAIA